MTRVLHIPGVHPYVAQCVANVPGVEVVSLPGTPNPALDPGWPAAHHDEIDVVHLHFGFEHLHPDDLRSWVDALAEHDLPLVYTVHDLRNPHQLSPEPHDRHLDVLIRSAAVLFTLTPGAAQEIERRWQRRAEVVPHPFVIDPATRPVRPPSRRRVGLALKDLRTNIVEPDRVVLAAVKGAGDAGARVQVDLHPGALQHPGLAGLRELARRDELDLVVHERFDDQELAEYLAGLDAFVLPYRFGTHSGWLEACRDVGTRVVVPSCGYYREQWDETVEYDSDERTGLDEASLADAVRRAVLLPPPGPVAATFRHDQRERVRALHAQVYADLGRSNRSTS